jgi:hypothetical protein
MEVQLLPVEIAASEPPHRPFCCHLMSGDDDDVRQFARAMIYANGAADALAIARRAAEFQRQRGRPDRVAWWLRIVDAITRFR